MEGINTVEKYQKALSNFGYAHEDDKKMAWQILEMFEKEKMNVCRAKIILTYVYELLEIQSYVTTEQDEEDSYSKTEA